MFYAIDERYLPRRMTRYSAGLDVMSRIDCVILPGTVEIVPTGVFIDTDSEAVRMMRESAYVALYIRSSLAKEGLMLANGVGVIDLDYEKEIMLLIYNAGDMMFKITEGQRIGQLIVMPHLCFNRDFINARYEDERRFGGFGSTDGKKI